MARQFFLTAILSLFSWAGSVVESSSSSAGRLGSGFFETASLNPFTLANRMNWRFYGRYSPVNLGQLKRALDSPSLSDILDTLSYFG